MALAAVANRQWWLLQNVEIMSCPVNDWFLKLIQLYQLFPMIHTQGLPSPALAENQDCEVCSVSYCLRVTSNCHNPDFLSSGDFSERHISNVSLSDDVEHISCAWKHHIRHIFKKAVQTVGVHTHAGCEVGKWHWLSSWIFKRLKTNNWTWFTVQIDKYLKN